MTAPAVTARNSSQQGVFPSRNAQLKAWQEVQRRISTAQHDCSICARCGSAIAEGQPVWWERTSYTVSAWGPIRGGRRLTFAPWCAACHQTTGIPERCYVGPRPCHGCGRDVTDVHLPHWVRWRQRPVCSRRCVTRYQLAERKAARPRPASPVCAGCGETFTPPRADGRYCSPACRQRAYRKRQNRTEPED